MKDHGSVCPTGWALHTSPISGCGRTKAASYICDSAFFSVSGQTYSRVCGRILDYQVESTDAFHSSVRAGRTSIDSGYVNGVSMTHGPAGSRQHIWAFASALYDNNLIDITLLGTVLFLHKLAIAGLISYPHSSRKTTSVILEALGLAVGIIYYSDDPLWDGAGCGEDSTCCQFNNPPWFYSTLPQATTNNVEARICLDQTDSHENVVIYFLEIFVRL